MFAQLRIAGGVARPRTAIDATFVQVRLLREGSLSALNPETRRVLYRIAETGLRPSEAVNEPRPRRVLIKRWTRYLRDH
jgi:hypothetical protein